MMQLLAYGAQDYSPIVVMRPRTPDIQDLVYTKEPLRYVKKDMLAVTAPQAKDKKQARENALDPLSNLSKDGNSDEPSEK